MVHIMQNFLFAVIVVGAVVLSTARCAPLQQEADKVTALPGQPPVGFSLYAGNVTVDELEGRDLFYVFAECSNDTLSTKPLVLWLNGGPGCSSLASGFAQENGPFHIYPNSSSLYVNEFAWNTEVNMIWLESPIGVGFSFSRLNMTANEVGGDNRTADDAYQFLVGWLDRFPQYMGRDFYLTGESYAGHYVPQLAKVIVDRNKISSQKINLKGYMVGNPDIDTHWDDVGDIDYYYYHAMISTETYNGLKQNCNWTDVNCCSDLCNQIYQNATNEIGNIDYYSIYTPACIANSSGNGQKSRKQTNNWVLQRRAGYDPCTENYAEIYFNRPEVQQAMHANVSGEIPFKWTECSNLLYLNWTDAAWSIIPTYYELIAAGLKIWVYSGDVDSVVPVTSTRYSIEAMKLPIVTPWHPWYDHEQVGGRAVVYDGLTYLTVRGAGHQVPLLQPSRFLQMLIAFIEGEPLPNSPFA